MIIIIIIIIISSFLEIDFEINIYTFIHLKMTSERSKRRDFLSLIFISKSIIIIIIIIITIIIIIIILLFVALMLVGPSERLKQII